MSQIRSKTGKFISKKKAQRIEKVSTAQKQRHACGEDTGTSSINTTLKEHAYASTDTTGNKNSASGSSCDIDIISHEEAIETEDTGSGTQCWRTCKRIIDLDELSDGLESCHDTVTSSINTTLTEHTYASTDTTGNKNPVSAPICDIDIISHEEAVRTEDTGLATQHWRTGRRIVDLDVLSDGLESCNQCHTSLHLTDCVGETQRGLGGYLHIFCRKCGSKNIVPYGKQHPSSNRDSTEPKQPKSMAWDVNSKMALGMLHAGIGERQANSLLATMNIKGPNHKTLKRREREVGKSVEDVAKESTFKALREEESMSQDAGEAIAVSVDGAWQKRGSGRSYNSLSGHCTMIGTKTKKCVGYSVRSKTCRTCELAHNKGKPPKPHDCRMNWGGSAKGMEPDMVVEMVTSAREKGVKVGVLVGDEDSTTIARVRKEVDPAIDKKSDSNHVKKILGNSLYSLQKKHKQLTVKVIKYLQKCFNYMLKDNNGNPAGVKQGLQAMTKHPFGNHDSCDSSWCRFLEDPSAKYTSLPYGRPLTDANLQISLENVFSKFNDQAEKLASLASTQANESLNKTVASKTPKTHHFSGSESLSFRVAAAIAQKNVGHTYVSHVNEALGLSPSRYAVSLGKRRDETVAKQRAVSSTRAFKRRQLQLKSQRSSSQAVSEVCEGTTYEPGTEMSGQREQDIQSIPEPMTEPQRQPLPTYDCTEVIFDLEATGLARTSHITQIAATTNDNKVFSVYVKPQCNITTEASKVTGLTLGSSGQLFLHGKPVTSVGIKEALSKFVVFLSGYSRVLLVGHNIISFDIPILLNAAQKAGMLDQITSVCGFLDTKYLIKSLFPGRASYKQEDLVRDLLNEDYLAHDAVEDVKSLQKLLQSAVTSDGDKLKHTMQTNSFLMKAEYNRIKALNLASLQPLIKEKAISPCIAGKIAGSGLSLTHLKLAHSRDGLQQLFSQPLPNGKPRVSKSQKIVDKVVKHLV